MPGKRSPRFATSCTPTRRSEMSGQLFTQYYLTEGIKSTTRWHSAAANAEAFRDGVQRSYDVLDAHRSPNEAVTEQELIRPGAGAAGMGPTICRSRARPATRTYPDHAVVSRRADSKARAAARTTPRGAVPETRSSMEESKRFGLPLDARDADGHGPLPDAARPDTPLPVDASEDTSDVGEPDTLGHPDERRRVASIRPPRPSRAPSGYFETDLADGAAVRQRGRPAHSSTC